MSLATLGLSEEIVKAVIEKGYKEATDIQKRLIPTILSGRDLLAGAQTGSGKTAGYALPILHSLNSNNSKNNPRALILVPTKELTRQVYESFINYGKYTDLRYASIYGGTNIASQARILSGGVDIIMATSGRLLEHIRQKNISLESIEHLIIDEADTMLDMGFIKEIVSIIELLPKKRQNILISATLTPALKRLSDQILNRPILIETDKMNTIAKNIKQILYPVAAKKKSELLSYLIGSKNYHQVLVFTRKKGSADKIAKELNLNGLKSEAIHGDKSSGARKRSIDRFKDSSIRVLVATDIAARGLDIPSLEIVINYDIPHLHSDYIHRIGRTGRAGRAGLAIILNSPEESIPLKDLERLLGRAIPVEILPEYAPPESLSKDQKKLKINKSPKKTGGAFGNKKTSQKRSNKKRKTTKRDGWRR